MGRSERRREVGVNVRETRGKVEGCGGEEGKGSERWEVRRWGREGEAMRWRWRTNARSDKIYKVEGDVRGG